MAEKDDAFLKKLQATFAVEADEHLKAITAGLIELEKAPERTGQKEVIQTIFREAHSLKGAAGAVNRRDITAICQPLEGLFSALNTGLLTFSPELFDAFHQTVNRLERMLSSPESQENSHALIDLLNRYLQEGSKRKNENKRDREPRKEKVRQASTFEEASVSSASLSRPPAAETVRVPSHKLDAIFRKIEEMISAKLAAEQRVVELREMYKLLNSKKTVFNKVRSHLQAVQTREQSVAGRINMPGFDKYLDEEDVITQSMEDRLQSMITAAAADSRALAKMVDNLLEEVKKMLMMPLSSLFEVLPKIVRELAREQGKEIELIIQGDGIEIDRRIQEQLKDPLIHIIRNCVDHGIEKPAERNRKNKPARARIAIKVHQVDAAKAEIVISDDGAGINLAKIISVAQKNDVITPEQVAQLTEKEIALLVFCSGISTSPVVTDISGRGLGLAIVRERIEKLNGTITLQTRMDAGTEFRITLPVTLSAFRGVVVKVAGKLFALPTMSVAKVARLSPGDIKTVENRETISLGGSALSLIRMADVLDLQAGAGMRQEYVTVIVLSSGNERIAFVVDEILYEQEILLKGLGSQITRVRNIAGSTTLGSGLLIPFLNVMDLMKSGVDIAPASRSGIENEPGTEKPGKSVLIAEDSITARSLLKNILEASGYQVKTAVDGIDALTTLKTTPVDLVVSDVEMPRMDGFMLAAKIRADKKLSEIPIILVTALDSRENRERGIDAGADAYIVKSDFDETSLLEVVRRLI